MPVNILLPNGISADNRIGSRSEYFHPFQFYTLVERFDAQIMDGFNTISNQNGGNAYGDFIDKALFQKRRQNPGAPLDKNCDDAGFSEFVEKIAKIQATSAFPKGDNLKSTADVSRGSG